MMRFRTQTAAYPPGVHDGDYSSAIEISPVRFTGLQTTGTLEKLRVGSPSNFNLSTAPRVRERPSLFQWRCVRLDTTLSLQFHSICLSSSWEESACVLDLFGDSIPKKHYTHSSYFARGWARKSRPTVPSKSKPLRSRPMLTCRLMSCTEGSYPKTPSGCSPWTLRRGQNDATDDCHGGKEDHCPGRPQQPERRTCRVGKVQLLIVKRCGSKVANVESSSLFGTESPRSRPKA
jgi:hypothetical protein